MKILYFVDRSGLQILEVSGFIDVLHLKDENTVFCGFQFENDIPPTTHHFVQMSISRCVFSNIHMYECILTYGI